MGLDIYLYRYEDFEETQKKENLYSEYENKVWEDLVSVQ